MKKAGKSVGIVGGGVGGLALAVGLQERLKRGVGVGGSASGIRHLRVYDAAGPPSPPGSLLLGLNRGAMASLHNLSSKVASDVQQESVSLSGIKLVDPQGTLLEEITADSPSGDVIRAIPRDNLRSIFLKHIINNNNKENNKEDDGKTPLVSFSWNNPVKTVRGIDNDNDESKLIIELEQGGGSKDNNNNEHDVVVGCDGLNSAVRRHLFARLYDQGHEPRFLRLYGIAGCVTAGGNSLVPTHLHNSVTNVFSEHEEMVLSLQCYHDSVYWHLVYQSPEKREPLIRPSILRKEALMKIKDWHTPFMHVIEASNLETINGMNLCDRETLTKYELSRRSLKHTIVIGDALHPLCPLGGFGENTNISLAEVDELCDTLEPFMDGKKEGPQLDEDLLNLQANMTEASRPFLERARSLAIRLARGSAEWRAEISTEVEKDVADKVAHTL